MLYKYQSNKLLIQIHLVVSIDNDLVHLKLKDSAVSIHNGGIAVYIGKEYQSLQPEVWDKYPNNILIGHIESIITKAEDEFSKDPTSIQSFELEMHQLVKIT
eukprot:CAMPEP_0114575262 /NCGR_PEP_ID=MMETSP0125-20121206/158_1 /TAXON_ID=485358 ORGANISM="Aristerostoma sp., Strain ATCC 50986" /NCGR_SAMPLE_ID=MMETSP0125 /ASSEMBLY_ACC=CAM_ASM_000245 /LENGTH=101 /DNA_ID=CAMNT_0001762869 /DNA_START=1519 /DNA_END=1824 /DNA_ORIENTATION=+